MNGERLVRAGSVAVAFDVADLVAGVVDAQDVVDRILGRRAD
jgi:hypothetical protein